MHYLFFIKRYKLINIEEADTEQNKLVNELKGLDKCVKAIRK